MKTLLVGMVMLLSVVGFVNAAEEAAASEGLGVDVTLDFNSKYVWRGQALVDDWVFQPGASTSIGDMTLGVWGNMDMTNENDEEWNFTEVDYYVDYSSSLAEGIGFSVGYIYYAFPQGSNDTQEVYGGLNFDTVLSPSVTWYYDVDEVEGSYVAFGLGHSIDLCEETPLSLDIGLNIGWADADYNSAYWGVDDDGFNDLTLSVGLPIEMGAVTVTPNVYYLKLIDSDIADVGKDDVVFAGISLGTSF